METKDLYKSDQLAFLNDFSTEVNLLKNQNEICSLICKSAKKMIGKGLVLVALFDHAGQKSQIKATEGFDNNKLVNKGLKLIKKDPFSMESPLKDIRKTDLKIYRSSKLMRIDGGLYTIMARKFQLLLYYMMLVK